MWVCGLDWAGPGQGQVADACECGNEPSGSIKNEGNFLTSLKPFCFSRRTLFHRASKVKEITKEAVLKTNSCLKIPEFCSKTLHFSLSSSRSFEEIFGFHFQGTSLAYLIIHNEGKKFLPNARNHYLDHSPVKTSNFAKHVSVGENGATCHGLKFINCHDGR